MADDLTVTITLDPAFRAAIEGMVERMAKSVEHAFIYGTTSYEVPRGLLAPEHVSQDRLLPAADEHAADTDRAPRRAVSLRRFR